MSQVLHKAWKVLESKNTVKDGGQKRAKLIRYIEGCKKEGWFPAYDQPFISERERVNLLEKERERADQGDMALARKRFPKPTQRDRDKIRDRLVLTTELLSILGNYTVKPRIAPKQQKPKSEPGSVGATWSAGLYPSITEVQELTQLRPYAPPVEEHRVTPMVPGEQISAVQAPVVKVLSGALELETL